MERMNSYRMLKLRELLFHETDDDNELGMQQIKDKLQYYAPEVLCDNRTIKKDLEVLDTLNFEIVENKGKYGKKLYSHQARLFETYQLRLIIDAILSARFITPKEKKHLIEKVKKLTSKHIAKTLPEPFLFHLSSNQDYEMVKLNIDHIHRAIASSHVLAYQYGRFNVNKEFVFGRDGALYFVEPYALIWQNDYYYLIGRFQENDELRHYRLDRIRNIQITDETFTKKEFHLQEYVDQSFHMFAGEEIRIKIQFHIDLVHVVLDRFGLDASIKQVDEAHFVLSTKAKLSEGLINWILTWGSQAKVLAPDHLVQTVKGKIIEMGKVYE
ncbi:MULTISPECIES: WYL domain-containing protein [unclassified Virgibacillus]|uniref:helix-turn-helix transcriptional regulator n=1 Tax=unclassified Virgibacillus TaxID=2620237 RepID=UPI0024DED660|nr:WYL domain-containing protein [Virgibacillus sp. LDC-1]